MAKAASANLGHRQVDICVDRILALLANGVLQPGQKLGEGRLARQLSMGMAPVKMALDQLSYVGIVERRPRSGTYVSQWTADDYLQVMQMRAGLETMSAALAATHADAATLRSLRTQAAKVDAIVARAARRGRFDATVFDREMAFHITIAQASGNRFILRALAEHRMLASCMRLSSQFPPPRLKGRTTGGPTHVAVVRAIASGDPQQAALTMRQHILVGLDLKIGV